MCTDHTYAYMESIYVTLDTSGVEIKILGAVAQLLGARIKILCVASQRAGVDLGCGAPRWKFFA